MGNTTNSKNSEHFSVSENQKDFKSRLEKKLCTAKETPEPDFDLSDCNLKSIPAGVFINCKVLRKEVLNLNRNSIESLVCTGNANLSDLWLLQTLNLRENKLKTLPNEINQLTNLRELLVGSNGLSQLPSTINTLQYLEHLDVSDNQLTSQSIDVINCMPSLRILNLTGNRDLIRLPRTLATCDNLYDLLIDSENFVWPAVKILQSTTTVILQYLTTGEFNVSEDDFGRKSNNRYEMLNNHGSRKEEEKIAKREVDMDYDNDDMLLAFKRQQEQKQQLLEAVLRQQCEADKTVSKMQQLKDDERNKLIKDILKAEDTANIVINKFLALKTIEDTSLKDKERMEEERLLEKLNLDHSDLRKQEILKLISQSIVDEEKKIKNYNRTRNQNAIQILQTDDQMSTNLNKVYLNYQDNKTKAIVQICEDENLQKRAVSELIAINDSRSWGLVEQMKIVEAELAEMTTVELQRKRKLSDDQLNDFADKRMQLTGILMSLLDQQELRKKELLDTLCAMESQRTLDQEDFWLLQYQRLLDSRPLEFSPKMASIDPVLGYHFLCNGVIHCLPFLQKLFQNMKLLIEDINEDDLKEAGIKSENDRLNILKSIKEFVNSRLEKPSAPLREVEKAEEAVEIERDNTVTGSLLSECVVCMEENVSTIFIPCGHLCCCENCQGNMEICPICRGEIEKRVKIIQP